MTRNDWSRRSTRGFAKRSDFTKRGGDMSDIVQRLRNWCTDWDRAPMARGEPPRDGLHCDDLLEAAAEIERLRNALEPFVAFRDQSPSQMAMIIHKRMDGL